MKLSTDSIQTLVLQRLKFRAATVISNEQLRYVPPAHIDMIADHIFDGWIASATWTIPGKTWDSVIATTRVPDGWWQAVKAELFPRWLHRRFPARLRTIETHLQTLKVCPELGPWQTHGHTYFFLDDAALRPNIRDIRTST